MPPPGAWNTKRAGAWQHMAGTVGTTFLVAPQVHLQAPTMATGRNTMMSLTHHCSDLIYSYIIVIKLERSGCCCFPYLTGQPLKRTKKK